MKSPGKRFSLLLVIITISFFSMGKRVKTTDMENSIPFGSWIWLDQEPIQRGDVVLIHNPLEPKQTRLLRVLAIAGDQIAYHNDGFVLNGKRLHQLDMDSIDSTHRRFQETLYLENGEKKEWLISTPHRSSAWKMPTQQIPINQIFLACDHRWNCLDSRWWGSVPQDLIIGRVWLQLSKPDLWHSLWTVF